MRSFPRALQLPSMQWLPLDCRSSIILGARVLQNSFQRTRLAKSSNHLHTQESVATSFGFQFRCWKTSKSTSSLRWPLVHWQVGECVQRYCFGRIILFAFQSHKELTNCIVRDNRSISSLVSKKGWGIYMIRFKTRPHKNQKHLERMNYTESQGHSFLTPM
ncbi:hypothetical protein F2Q69_00000628 [Brassica cretica]|uniref:Uncharacterized protein n=1 Tax=Brassica cretica TaxID=69181 RepID=A0A8S9P791_BRACR|nr:hypothetical protein F2Q69_00000628 [Brassica cretica]